MRPRAAPYSHHPDIALGNLVHVYCGARGWQLAKPSQERTASIVYPADRDPALYRWPVAGRHVLVFALDCPLEAVDLLVVELLRANAACVQVVEKGGHIRYSYEPPGQP